MLNNDFVSWGDSRSGLDQFREFANEKYYQDHGELNERDLIEETAYQTCLILQGMALMGGRLEQIENELGMSCAEPAYTPPKAAGKPAKSGKP